MLASISMKQFFEWQAYASLEPFDEVRGDYRAALIASTLVNVHRKKGRPAARLENFLLRFEARERSEKQLLMLGKFLAASYNAEEDHRESRKKKPVA